MAKLKRGVLTNSQLKAMMRAGYLSAKGKKVAKEALAGKHKKTRYRQKKGGE